jgi:hypothetical protein
MPGPTTIAVGTGEPKNSASSECTSALSLGDDPPPTKCLRDAQSRANCGATRCRGRVVLSSGLDLLQGWRAALAVQIRRRNKRHGTSGWIGGIAGARTRKLITAGGAWDGSDVARRHARLLC